MTITAYDLALRFVGTKETPGVASNPLVLAMLRLDAVWPEGDDVAWCSAFVNFIAWLLRLPRSKSLAARSWLNVGIPIELADAVAGWDVVVLSRDGGGHVGFYAGHSTPPASPQVLLLGGNQSDAVTIAPFDVTRVLGVRRLLEMP